MLDKISESCAFLLNSFPEANSCKEYINSRINQNTQDLFQFGYFPNINNINVLSSIIGENTLEESKLFYHKEIEDSLCFRKINISYFENYPLIMPFRDTYGEIVALIGRTLLSEESRKKLKISKYKNTVFAKGNYLFGLYENKANILKQNCVYVVEGQFDVIKAFEKGFKNVVALSNSNMTAYQLSLITRYTNNIFLLLDNDEAGEKGRKKIISKFGKLANIRNFYLPTSYKDIDEYLSSNDYDSMSLIVKD